MNAKMTTTFADSTTFTSELQKTMEINQVTSISLKAISAGVSSSSSSSTSSLLSPSSAAAAKEESSRLEKVRAAAAKVVAENTTATVLGILFAVLVLFACCLFATRNHDKKKPNGSTPSAENSNDLEQPKAVVELTANPMKQAK